MTAAQPQTIHLNAYQPPPYLIDTVALEFELDPACTRVKHTMDLRINSDNATTQALHLDGEALTLLSVHLNDRLLKESVDYTASADALCIHMPPKHFSLTIVTQIAPKHNTTLSGLYVSGERFYTQCEAQGFRRITYMLDRPDVMARFTTKIIADAKRYPVLLSNGNLIETGQYDTTRHYVIWQDPHRKPAYLFALVAGDLCRIDDQFTTQAGRDVDIAFYVEPRDSSKCKHAIHALKQAMRWDETRYGLCYDLDIYMVVAVHDFNMGAMENKGLNLFNAKYVLADESTATDTDFQHITHIIGHEYFHNWTGNRVTLRDWFQLSLKEGLTVFREQQFAADCGSAAVQRVIDAQTIMTTQFAEDASPMAHPVRPESYIEINNFYTVTIYNKGAELIRVLHTLLGKHVFKQGMELYFARHDGQAVTIDDFLNAMSAVTTIDISQFQHWYAHAGTPVLHVDYDYHPSKKQLVLHCKQFCQSPVAAEPAPPLLIPIRCALFDPDSRAALPIMSQDAHRIETDGHECVLLMTEQSQSFVFEQLEVAPVISLLRDFSAPVRLQLAIDRTQRLFLAQVDTDHFVRWHACQTTYIHAVAQLLSEQASKEAQQQAIQDAANLVMTILNDKTIDKMQMSQLLTIPHEGFLAESLQLFDTDAIHQARETLYDDMAATALDKMQALYQSLQQSGSSGQCFEAMAERALKHVALNFITQANPELGQSLAASAYQHSDNMTDTLAALQIIADRQAANDSALLATFYQRWKHDPLVINKWLAVQAKAKGQHTLDNVMSLMQHEAFDEKVPNKVYALLLTLVNANPVVFHDKSGKTYQFIADCILRIDKFNPQVASRLCGGFLQWRRFDERRREHQVQQIKRIKADPALSNDVYELVSKALA